MYTLFTENDFTKAGYRFIISQQHQRKALNTIFFVINFIHLILTIYCYITADKIFIVKRVTFI